jgi:pyruvate ferredoxin oxidoreductase beta subunit
MAIRGARYLHVHVPCPLGWGTASDATLRVARLAVQCGLFPLFEAEHGEVTRSTPIRRLEPVDAYLRAQQRFAHLFAADRPDAERIARLQAIADRNIARFHLLPTGDTP